ncbi:MAG: alpha amylase N-terminal ig-like domain-containing protein [Acholeplasmataceae bacterium]|nr:alpha amylase N-terminal ig-like domain-containing protein [Acholeplasmataceae bacterium]
MKLKLIIPMLIVVNLVAVGILVLGLVQNNREGMIKRFVNHDIAEVFHDQGYIYMDPLMPSREDDITLRVRTYRGNVTEATILYTFDLDSNEKVFNEAEMAFEKVDETGEFEYWVGVIPKQNNPFTYYFRLENEKESIHYNASGYSLPNEDFSNYNGNYLVMPGLYVPLWAQGTTWYSIMPDSFFNGDATNDKWFQQGVLQNPWGNSHFGGNDYFGGDLSGIDAKIDYLQSINAESLQLNPIWVSTHQAGYGTFDFSQIDSAFGNSTSLIELTNALHARDMTITLDGVFKYFNENGVWYNRYNNYPLPGAVNPNDPYYSIYMRDEYNNIIRSWGSPEIDFSDPLARELIYVSPESILQTYYRDFNIDGFRLDVGESLRGSDPNNWGTAEQIIKDMRHYIKAIDPDKLLMSEHGGGDLIFDYILDTKWNYGFGWPVRDWAAGISNNVVLQARLVSEINRMPRPIANASYNFLTTHDESRILNYVDNDPVAVNAAQLLQMTYIGSPSVYFGDEIGMLSDNNPGVGEKAPTSFDAFNWDSSTWNMQIFNMHRALTQLREDYEKVFQDGAYMPLVVDGDIFSYGRWNEGGKVITAINNSHETIKEVKLEARQLSIPDGTVLTDYLSGQVYVVKDGYVTVDVMPGGLVLVDGDQKGLYRGLFESTIDDSSQIIKTGPSDYMTTGNGALDNGVTGSVPGYNNVMISATYRSSSNGSGALMIQDDKSADAPFYAATLSHNGRVVVNARQSKGGAIIDVASTQLSDGQAFRIVRGHDNQFTLEVHNGTWQQVEGSKTRVQMDYQVDVGLSPIDGDMTFYDVNVSQADPQRADTFDNGLGSMFMTKGLALTHQDGKVTMASEDQPSLLLTQAPYRDFTITARFDVTVSNQEAYQGLVVSQDQDNAVVGGVIYLDDETHAFIGTLTNGYLTIYETAPYVGNTMDARLEKVGAYYQLSYKTDETWRALEARVNRNYSELRAGAITSDASITLDHFGFGDSLNDGTSLADYGYNGDIDYDYSDNAYIANQQQYAVSGGSWAYVFGGVRQSDVDAEEHVLDFANATFRDFKTDFTWQLFDMKESGTLTFQFGYALASPQEDDGYTLTLDATGLLVLAKEGVQIETVQIADFDITSDYRFVVERSYGQIRIYQGITPIPIMSTSDEGAFNSRMRIVGKEVDYALISPNTYHGSPNWLVGRGNLTVSGEEASLQVISDERPYHFSYLTENGVSDVMFAANIKLQKLSILRSEFGLIIGGDLGSHPLRTGLYLGVTEFGDLILKADGETVASVRRDDIDVESFYLIVAVSNRRISIYIDEETDPALVYEDDRTRGGVIGFYTDSANVTMSYLSIRALAEGEDYTQLDAFTDRSIDAPPAPNPSVSEDLATEDIVFDLSDPATLGLFNRYNGSWTIDDGELRVNSGTGNWYAGATIAAGKFKDFELSYQVRVESGAFGGAIIRKNFFNDNHEVSGMLLYKNMGIGGIVGYTGTEIRPISSITLDAEGFAHVVVRVVGQTLEVSAGDGVNMATYTYEMTEAARVILDEGYVSLISGNATTTFRGVSIRILDASGNYVND